LSTDDSNDQTYNLDWLTRDPREDPRPSYAEDVGGDRSRSRFSFSGFAGFLFGFPLLLIAAGWGLGFLLLAQCSQPTPASPDSPGDYDDEYVPDSPELCYDSPMGPYAC
jgi:hypothetical protein